MLSDSGLAIEHIRDGDTESMRVEGEVDLATVEQFETAILTAISDSPAEVRLDLSGIAFFGSEGVRALVSAHQAAIGKDVKLVVSASSRTVRRVLEISRLEYLLAADANPA